MHHNVTQTECKRCGKCCLAGGPALHLADKDIVVSGFLRPADLVTFRTGEPAVDPRTGTLIILENELIKIRGENKVGACKFYSGIDRGCLVYQNRPLECRLLRCWDTSALEAVLLKELLSRAVLIPAASLIGRLIAEHGKIFNMRFIASCLSERRAGNFLTFFEEAVNKELRFRKEVMSEFSIDECQMDFFFGRSMEEVFQPFLGDSRWREKIGKNEPKFI